MTFFMITTKKVCLLITSVGLSISAIAQKDFTIAEATNGMATTLAVQGIKQGSWRPGTTSFFQVEKNGNNELWKSTDIPGEGVDEVITLSKLNKALGSSMKAMPVFVWLDKDHAYFTDGAKLIMGTFSGESADWKVWRTLPDKAQNIAVDAYRNIVYTIDNNLYMVTGSGKEVKVTNNIDKNIISGQAVHRNEFGIDKGIFLSPKGNLLAYYRMDQTMVKDYPIINWAADPAAVDIIKYPMAGGTSHQATLCVYDPATGKNITLKTGEGKDHYLTAVSWSPDEKYIFIGLLNRAQNHMSLNRYDAKTGALVNTLFEETDDKYVEPQHPLYFIPGSNDKFIWWSQRSGYMHLYLYSTNGSLLNRVTQGDWVVNEIAGFNKSTNEIIITAAKESPMEKHAYAANIETGDIRRIDKGEGMHNIWVSENGQYMYDVYNSETVPRKSVIRAVTGDYNKTLLVSEDPLSGYRRAEVRNVTLKADDGTPLYGKLILPPNFNQAKKYPVIVYLYNGPHVQLLHNSYPASGNLWYEYMAQKGYIVFTMDGRGSGNRGLAFEQATFRNLGTVEIQDQLKGVAYLKSLPYVDAARLGVHGWSFGGFMTTSLMLRNPGIFKCGVAGGPVIDWSMYEIMYTERYMDSPLDNKAGYEKANLLTKVKNLEGDLLLIHGTNDDVVVWQHSVKFLKACVDEGVQLDYFVYPGHLHNVRGKDRVHLMQKITDYFDQHL
jgi:dipeptidyl-peptidase-4